MTGPQCQHEAPSGAEFCPKCGAKLTVVCDECGTANAPDHNFCKKCGHRLVPSGADTPRAIRFGSPETYTPKHLAERILTSKSGLEGERKQVTVLFADLKGSMELLADRDPEEARKLLDPILEHMMEAIHRYEGTVNQVMGDGIMALFGAPLAHEDHAVRACYAALRIQASVRQYAEEARRAHGINVQVRIGLNSGEVVVREIGNDLRMDYSAVGQTTHLAARMEQLATPGTILLTAETLRLAEGLVEVTRIGLICVKGLANSVEAFELIGHARTRRRFEAAAARGLTRFVGRRVELEALQDALDRARAGHGQVVAPVAEAGVGKSRLFWEFTHSHRTLGWLILESGSASYGKATPCLPLVDLLKAYFRIQDRDDHREIREKIIGKLLALDRALEDTLTAFLALLDVPVEDPHWRDLDPTQRRQRTFEAITRLLLRESQAQPLVLVFEDLHWIDAETQAFLDRLVESLPTARILLLVNYRPEYQPNWGSRSYCMELRMDPLPPEGAEELLEALIGGDAGLQPLKRLLIARTEGNPFFLEESVRTLVETKALTGDRGAYRLARPIETIRVPASVRAILAARIDRLPLGGKTLLQTAAVIGKDVPFALLQAIVGEPEEELRQGLSHLRAAEFLHEASLFPELEYSFKHALTHEVAYGSLLHERKRVLHARIVDAIERLYHGRRGEQIDRLAYHAFQGEAWGKAVAYLREAGSKAAARSAHREAVTLLELGLVALGRLPQNDDTVQLGVDLRFELKTALTPLAEWAQIIECLREAETLATRLGDQLRLGRVSAYKSDCARIMGDHERAVDAGHHALRIAKALADFSLQINTNAYLGLAHYARGDYREAAAFFRTNVDSLASEQIPERFGMAQPPSVHSRAWLACCLAGLGEFTDGIAYSTEGLRIAVSLDDPLSLSVAYFGVGHLHLQRGDFQEAIRELQRGLDLSRRWSIQTWFLNIAAALGSAHARSGRILDGITLLEEAVERSVAMRRQGFHSIRMVSLSEAYLLAGRLDDATELARQALALAREHKERGHEAWALHLLGGLAASGDRSSVEKAAGDYSRAMALAAELGMRPLLARCHLDVGSLHTVTGNRGKAEAHLNAAVALFREIGMRFWLERAEGELVRSP